MSDRTHQIRLSEDLDRRLQDRAAAAGTDVDTFIVQTIEEKLQHPTSFREIFAPLQAVFVDAESSDRLDETFEHLVRTIRQLRKSA